MRRSIEDSVIGSLLNDAHSLNATCIIEERRYSYNEIVSAAEVLSNDLVRCGVQSRQRIAICLPHSRQYVVLLVAAYLLDVSIVMLNPSMRPTEILHVLEQSGAQVAICWEDFSGPDDLATGTVILGDNLKLLHLRCRPYAALPNEAFVIFTSGSSGLPKGVLLSGEGVSANAWGVVEYLGLKSSDIGLVYTPPGYVYALSQTMTHLAVRATLVPYRHGLTFPDDLADRLRSVAATGFATNPTGLRVLLRKVGGRKRITSARYVMTGGQPLNGRLLNSVKTVFPNAAVINTYGTTETSSRIACWTCPSDAVHYIRNLPVGFPITGTRVKVIDDDGIEAPDGVIGNILVSAPSLALGYLSDKRLTDARFHEGWFNTGDRGEYRVRTGLILSGRADDVILVGHEKVGPEEIEMVLESVDGVIESAVIGVSHDILEQVPVAFLVCSGDFTEIVSRCREQCADTLSHAKRPREFFQIDELPHTLYGKLDRKSLRQKVLSRSETGNENAE